MAGKTSRQGKITEENEREAELLRELWEASADKRSAAGVGSQGAFGESFDIGNQGAVWQYLNAKTALSKKAAAGFARGLGCRIADFSPRLAAEIEALSESSSEEPGAAEIHPFEASLSPPGVALISVNLAYTEGATLLRMVQAARLPGVNVEVTWTEQPAPESKPGDKPPRQPSQIRQVGERRTKDPKPHKPAIKANRRK
jgi:hypothetical protein